MMSFTLALILLLFIAAAALVVVEVFLPTHGVLGLLGVLLAIVGIGVVFHYNQRLGVGVAYGLAIATPFAIVLWMKIWPRTPFGRRLILSSPPAVSRDDARAAAARHVGQTGVAVSELRPGGTCEIAGERVSCRAEHGLIPRGTAVRVIAVVDGYPVVRPA